MYYHNFGVFYKNTMNYLTTNPDRDVVKHKVDDLLTTPRHLPNTRIPNQHTGYSTIGVIFLPLQQKLLKTLQNEAIVPLITINALIYPSELLKPSLEIPCYT